MDYKPLLEALLQNLKISKKRFAESIGASQGNVSDWFNKPNARPSIDALKRISDTHNVNLNWLITGEGDMFKQLDIPISPTPKSFHLPVIEDIAAGSPIDVSDFEPDHFIDIPGTALLLPPPYYAFQVSGNSMEPEIYASDIVIVSGSWYDINLDDRICAFRTGEGIILKRLELNHKSKFGKLYSINYRAHKPIKYDRDTEDLTLIGVLCLLIRNYLKEEK